MLQSQEYIVIIIALYTSLSLKESERRKENKYVFIDFVILNFLFIIADSFHLFLRIQVTIWNKAQYFLQPISFALLLNILNFYVLYSQYCFIQLLLKSVKEKRRISMHLYRLL